MKRVVTLALALLVPAVAGAEPETAPPPTPFDSTWSVGVGYSYPVFHDGAAKDRREAAPFLTLAAPVRVGSIRVEPEVGLGGRSVSRTSDNLGDLRWYRLGLAVGYETAPSPGTRLTLGPWAAALLRLERSPDAVTWADPLFDWQAGIATVGEVALSSYVAVGGTLRAGIFALDDWIIARRGTYAFGEVQLSVRFVL